MRSHPPRRRSFRDPTTWNLSIIKEYFGVVYEDEGDWNNSNGSRTLQILHLVRSHSKRRRARTACEGALFGRVGYPVAGICAVKALGAPLIPKREFCIHWFGRDATGASLPWQFGNWATWQLGTPDCQIAELPGCHPIDVAHQRRGCWYRQFRMGARDAWAGRTETAGRGGRAPGRLTTCRP